MSHDIKELRRRMDGAYDVYCKELTGLRTGRASTNMLESVMVDMYGSKMPLNQVGTVSVTEARMLTVTVWDASAVKAVEKGIMEAGLGLNPQPEGAVIRVPVPELNEERRVELVKVAGKYAENSRISVRNVRKDGMDTLKRLEKDKEITEDEHKKMSEDVQKLTDEIVKKIDAYLITKEKDIMTI